MSLELRGRGLICEGSSIYQTGSIVDASTAAAMAVEEDIIDVIEVDCS